ncbi:MAG: flagellar rod assembly protein/muramidase FlgJ [Hydrogenophilales bacterium 16-64-46]|nr:MAG: flagellar rod assembly protein/muramidase FlgJ [Hydrogenophilales bacterium 12-64-13]OYZ05028.1 MAG: flagellar rod assembly protein/muramidase FlgJ [Hydrogenophilales bacterium 16-64-46]OZA36779.1 MAG: flagellar rod assembly protein/muramidase FlgJ [Hydrogenophilales bacterium 17-64-34]HQT00069.1 flagellar assembly peptidoglycan hydrolase FlgJ [Thiobacillus sp.]
MTIGNDLAARFALDVQGVDNLKLQAKQASPEALKSAAQQFEAVFMNMLLKSMRETTSQDGMFDSEQTRMYTSMLDQQLAQNMASRGVGLADVMVRQLSLAQTAAAQTMAGETGGLPLNPEQALPLDGARAMPLNGPASPVSYPLAPGAATPGAPASGDVPAHVSDFTQRMLPHARSASAATGIPARFMVGQAALETGWGRQAIRGADGADSHNLFGIKAGGGWKGRTVDIVTTEYVGGKPVKQVDTFRAYDSYADAFRDYASLLRGNARYQNVIAQGGDAAGFAQGLQQAGYATDPAYARKLAGVIQLVEKA